MIQERARLSQIENPDAPILKTVPIRIGDIPGIDEHFAQDPLNLKDANVQVSSQKRRDGIYYQATIDYPFYGAELRSLLSVIAPAPGQVKAGIEADLAMPDKSDEYNTDLRIQHEGAKKLMPHWRDFALHRRNFLGILNRQSPREISTAVLRSAAIRDATFRNDSWTKFLDQGNFSEALSYVFADLGDEQSDREWPGKIQDEMCFNSEVSS